MKKKTQEVSKSKIPSDTELPEITQNQDSEDNNPLGSLSSELLDNLDENTKTAFIQSMSFRGPLPPPSLLQEYERILPGISERMFKMKEKEQDHRHTSESKALDIRQTEGRRGQYFGFIIGLVAFVVFALCAIFGQTIVAGVSLIPLLLSFAFVIIKEFRGSQNNGDYP